MKLIKCLLLLAVLAQLTACKKDIYQLPPETRIGANTFGCVLNGKVWSPRGSDGYSGTNKNRSYSYGGCYFILSATDHDSQPLSAFVIGFDSACMTVGVPMKLSGGRRGQGWAYHFTIGRTGIDDTNYSTNDSIIGELIFTKWEPPITSGKFWFDAIDKNGNIIHVTDGRFDVNR